MSSLTPAGIVQIASFKMTVLFRSKATGVPMFAFAEDCAGEDSFVKNCTSFHIELDR